MKKIRLALMVIVAALTTAACTPQQLRDWVAWNEQDPAAAQEFANRPEIQALLHQRAQAPAPQRSSGGGTVWDRIAQCESGQNWSINTGNGYSGGLQFLHSSWRAYGGQQFAPLAYQASREQQIVVAERILADVGWRAWPACTRRLGLR